MLTQWRIEWRDQRKNEREKLVKTVLVDLGNINWLVWLGRWLYRWKREMDLEYLLAVKGTRIADGLDMEWGKERN